MKGIQRKRAVVAVLALGMFAGGFVPRARADAVRASDAAAADATAAVSAAGCPSVASCGPGCTADLANGFCLLAVKWRGAAHIGGLQLGPAFEVSCNICECWYIFTNSMGNKIFLRTTGLGCGGGFSGITVVE